MQIARLERPDFIGDHFDYNRGEAVTFIEPTQGGKTRLAFQLLDSLKDHIPATVLVMKPRDATPAEWTRRLGYKEIPLWPPHSPWPWENRPPGYTLWPRQSLTDIDADNKHMSEQFKRALLHAYRKGDQIIFADEVYGLVAELGLATELTALWTRGSGMGAGLWASTQKPSGTQRGGSIPTFMYSASTHLFLGRDPDKRNTDRFGEIGGVDPKIVSDIVRRLPVNKIETPRGPKYISDKLYIDKRGPYMCLVGP